MMVALAKVVVLLDVALLVGAYAVYVYLSWSSPSLWSPPPPRPKDAAE